ncbi:aminoglycoside phosphotransferase family protein [Lederbergia wuyishanensis]|uniref:Aminoglycoside phosphotransferase (APT) family kinase protein n=1 Tax=Lederbergia wuyishanensis TaxID=1347903 RepID=A0ABU0D4F1_9BACI|nr:aminoglycoside phosphotransferase family protein [Lederbergia wuyishanensis]MCJ8008150.1 aminoglycoside phosphotransferase family protein [Lederbergia wuyishanensis]MDQ0343261.1 aminoglycoside phosphotransferase (APT) family kinase protein [Lederbergia wuyishanensis]
MSTPLSVINWIEKSDILDGLIVQEHNLTLQPMNQGYEAEVIKIESDNESFVLKVWNKSSKPDISFQFRLLNVLFERGLSVSKPVGWGINQNSHKVLLTTFNGGPVLKVNNKKMIDFAKILSSLHQTNIEEIGTIELPKYDFADYFFPEINKHPDIYNAVISLVHHIEIMQECIIHGDFHLANILEENDRYTVIDWTNGQLGDSRYDFAWSLTLKRIYTSERLAQVFRSTYLLKNDIPNEDLEVFESLACLRWILLSRSGGTPIWPNTIKRVKSLIGTNPFLQGVDI